MRSKIYTFILTAFAFVFLYANQISAQTFNGSVTNTAANSLIPSAGTGGCAVAPQTTGGTIFNNTVAGLVGGATLSQVRVNFTHTFDSDIDMYLVAPNGQILELSTDNGAGNDNYTNTIFDDAAATNITAGTAPFTGTFRPEGTLVASACGTTVTPTVTTLGGFTPGQNGVWQLLFKDDIGADAGTMLNWSLIFVAPPPPPCPTIANPTPIIIPAVGTSGPAGPYPSTINVAGVPGNITNVTVTLRNMNHTFPDDIDVLLVGPGGQTILLMSDAGGSADLVNNTYTFDDAAAATLADGALNASGTYQPSNFGTGDVFPAPAPVGPYNDPQLLSVFNGTNPNGTWSLYVFDDVGGDIGNINLGWELSIITDGCQACIVTCPANMTVSNDPNQCGAVVNYPAPTTSGSCGTVTASPASGSFFPVGTTVVNMVSSVGGGTCSFTIRVNDTQPPSITCPANISVNAAAGQCSAVVTFAAGTATDNCPGVTVTSNPASGSVFPVGTTTVTQTATDASGNTATCSFTVTVIDNQPPTIVCPSNITVSNTPNQCGAIVTFTVGSADNCSFQTITQSSSTTIEVGESVSCNNGVGHTENSYWRAYQLSSASPVTVSSIIFGIEDADAPGGTQPVNVRVHTSAGAFPGAVRTLVASQTFNIANQSGTLFTAALTTPPTVPGNSILVLEINTPDGRPAGNFFFIGSNTAPETGPSYLSAADCAITTPTTTAAIGFPDMHIILNAVISGPVTVVSSPASGSFFPVGVTTVTSTATDAWGNTATCPFTVRVNDTQAPTITCPANVTRPTDAGVCTATFTPNTPTAADNCAVTEQTWALTGVTTGTSPATGINTIGSRAFNIGVTTVTYTVKDAAGNTSTCTFTITVTDALLPVISTQPVNRTVCAGATATFSVVSSNAVTYQWQQFIAGVWTNIIGANAASFSVPNTVQSMNTNTFRVNVVGLCTTVPSVAVTLFVNPLPTISLTSSNPAVLLPGQTTSIVANVNPTGGTFAWFKNGVPRLPTVTTGTLSNLGVDDAGTYHAVYTDLNGCVATSANIVISAEASDLFFVAPNPNFGQFWVRYYNQLNEPLTVIVYDSKGARVHQQTSATTLPYTQINVNMKVKSGGIYLVELRGADGRRLGAKRIIVGAQ